MTREEALFKAKDVLDEATEYENAVCYVTGDDREWLELAIKALEQEQYYKELVESYEKTINKLTQAISEQEPKTGHWTWELDETPSTYMSPSELNYAGWVCNCCHEFPDDVCEWDDPDEPPTYNFCPNCGAKMESEE